MRYVVALCVGEVRNFGRCSVRVGFCVLLLLVGMECNKWTVRVCGGVNGSVAIEYSS